jgi:hypothetical protein
VLEKPKPKAKGQAENSIVKEKIVRHYRTRQSICSSVTSLPLGCYIFFVTGRPGTSCVRCIPWRSAAADRLARSLSVNSSADVTKSRPQNDPSAQTERRCRVKQGPIWVWGVLLILFRLLQQARAPRRARRARPRRREAKTVPLATYDSSDQREREREFHSTEHRTNERRQSAPLAEDHWRATSKLSVLC